MSKTAVLIPCYNESPTIEKVIRDFQRVMPDADIYVYDNNSTDGSDEIARKAGAIVCYEYKQGKGNVLRSMFRDIEADCYVMVDADDTYPAEAAPGMVQMVLEGRADMVIGDRLNTTYFEENKRPFHDFGNKLVRWLVNNLFDGNLQDIMTGYRAMNRRFVKEYPLLSKGFEVETEMSLFALDGNYLVKEVPVDYRDRPAGSESKLNTFSDGFRVLKMIVMLFRDYKPLLFFNVLAFLCFLLGTILVIPVLHDYAVTHLVERFPTLFVSIFLYIASLMFFCSGMILDVLKNNLRKTRETITKQIHK
ncbi:MAG: glycosyltransferase [Anaerolineaceae bacterium]|nr:glycosyltransferase [Anaerolineaceae bacterium]